MKPLLLIAVLSCSLIAETKQEADLKKQLAVAQAELAAEKARTKAFQTGTRKLTEAVETQIETSRSNGEKLDAVSSKIAAVEATGKSQTQITERATKKLADTVETQNAHITSAINAQSEQQKRALAAAKELARRLEDSNRNLAKTAEQTKRAKEETDAQLARANKSLDELNHKAEVIAAKDQTAIAHDKYQFYNSLAVPLCGVLGGLILVLQVIVAGKQGGKLKEMAGVQKEIHINTNGALSAEKAAREKAEMEASLLRQQLESVTGIKPLQGK